MPDKIDDLLPTAKEIQKQTALREAEKAEQYARMQAASEAEKRKLIEPGKLLRTFPGMQDVEISYYRCPI